MKISGESRRAVVQDAISYVIGLAPQISILGFPLLPPVSLSYLGLAQVYKKYRQVTSLTYVDWELENWPQLYRWEHDRIVELTLDGQLTRLPQTVLHDNFSRRLGALPNLRIVYDNREFQLTDRVRAHTEEAFRKVYPRFRRQRHFHNGSNVRLTRLDNGDSNEMRLHLQLVRYEGYIRTNLLLDYSSKRQPQTLRSIIHDGGKLEPLQQSSLADNLGINMLIFTADGALVVQKRSRKTAFRQGEWAPSASGTVSAEDVKAREFFKPHAILRETLDEIGVDDDDLLPEKLAYLGITRELIRGGEPEMFFTAQTKLTESEIRNRAEVAEEKWEVRKLSFFHFGGIAFQEISTPADMQLFLNRVQACWDTYYHRASITLLTAIAMWVKHRLPSWK